VQPLVYPVMWARDASASFVRAPAEMRALIEATGFRLLRWDDVTAETAGPAAAEAVPPHSIQRLGMGEALGAIIRAGPRDRGGGRRSSGPATGTARSAASSRSRRSSSGPDPADPGLDTGLDTGGAAG